MYQAHSSTHAPIDADTADLLIGREKLVDLVADHVQKRTSVLVVGAAGMGKTAILQAVAQRWLQPGIPRTALYCSEATTQRKTLQSLAEELYDRYGVLPTVTSRPRTTSRHLFARLSVGKLRQFVLPHLRAGGCVALLDHLGVVRGAYAAFLDTLVDDLRVPIVAAVRSLAPDDTGRLWWIGWNFTTIEVAPLSHKDARRLIDSCLDRARILLPDRQDFAKGVIKRAWGNPRLIKRLCELAGAPRYQIGGRTNLRLLWIDVKISNLECGNQRMTGEE